MASLKEIPDDLKVKAFHSIVDMYYKDSTLSQFGDEVQKLIITLRELYK
ncbi:hypothetical protein MKY96_32825 [Paenibacillus sp. FSL R7-0302]